MSDKKYSQVPKFSEIYFGPHPVPYFGGERAVVKFENGWGASIITGKNAYSDAEHPYEVAVLLDDSIDYSHGIYGNDDVFGHLNETEVMNLLAKIHALPPKAKAE